MLGVGNVVTAKRHERNLIIDMLYIIVVVMLSQDIYTYQNPAYHTPKMGVFYYLEIMPQ